MSNQWNREVTVQNSRMLVRMSSQIPNHRVVARYKYYPLNEINKKITITNKLSML